MTECACKWVGVGTPNPELIDACDAHRAWRNKARAEVRAATIEECAKMAERIVLQLPPDDTPSDVAATIVSDTAREDIAKAIRSLSTGGEGK